ncbi:MAG: hypothetical protein EOP06_19975, partial [Proteobacteria bacterium]
MKTKVVLIAMILLGAYDLQAACVVKNSQGQTADIQGDALFAMLQNSSSCPANVQSLRVMISTSGLATKPFMVANRGIHNPEAGSFSFFEQVSGTNSLTKNVVRPGEFFFGHFTTLEGQVVVADQKPAKGKLLIELLAWDETKKLFNFYELIGTATGGDWFYRGDSADILQDNS